MSKFRRLTSLKGTGASLAQAGGDASTLASAAVFLDPGAFQWVVPNGVTKLTILCVGGGSSYSGSATRYGGDTFVDRAGTHLCYATGGNQDHAAIVADGFQTASGTVPRYSLNTVYVTRKPQYMNGTYYSVELFGEGPAGQVLTTAGGYQNSENSSGYRYYYHYGGLPGGGGLGQAGTMAWVNEIPVTPGEILDLTVPALPSAYTSTATSNQNTYYGSSGGVVLCWGAGGYPRLHTIPQNVIYY
jgi:hypothetical protein